MTSSQYKVHHVAKLTTLSLLLLIGTGAIGCSQSSPSSNTGTSYVSPYGISPLSVTGQEPVAECNGITLSTSAMALELEDYYSNGQYNNGEVRGKVTVLPTAFASGAYFDFYRWQSDINGNASIDPTPMTYDLINPSGNSVLGSYSTNKLTQTVYSSLNSSSTIPNLELVIHGTSGNYQVIRVAVKQPNGSASDTIIDQADILIPAFTANPNVYATTHAALLNALHPLESLAGNGYSSYQYQQDLHTQFCFRTLGQ